MRRAVSGGQCPGPVFGTGAGRAVGLVLAAAVGVGATCSDPTGPLRDLGEAERQWGAAGLDDYAYTLRETCFCPPLDRWIQVADGVVVRVEPGEGVYPGTGQEGYTVEELFALIRENLDRDPDDVNLEFDPALGHPIQVFFDYEYQTADEEWGFRVEDFDALPR